MIRFPFFGYSYPYHYYPYYASSFKKDGPTHFTSHEIDTVSSSTDSSSDKESRKAPSKFNPISFHLEGISDPNEVIIEILGIKLYLDDLIILGLLFILYQEEVKDEMLFICLILLLLS